MGFVKVSFKVGVKVRFKKLFLLVTVGNFDYFNCRKVYNRKSKNLRNEYWKIYTQYWEFLKTHLRTK